MVWCSSDSVLPDNIAEFGHFLEQRNKYWKQHLHFAWFVITSGFCQSRKECKIHFWGGSTQRANSIAFSDRMVMLKARRKISYLVDEVLGFSAMYYCRSMPFRGNYCLHLQPWRWRQHVFVKGWHRPTKWHSAKTQDFINMMIIAVRTSNVVPLAQSIHW
jgi:hypothetical protein